MKTLHLKDFITAFVFGAIIFCGLLVFQKSRTHTSLSKITKNYQQKSKKNHLNLNSQSMQTQDFSSTIQGTTTPPSHSTESEVALNEETINDADSMTENNHYQSEDLSDIMNQKIENFITNDLNLSLSFYDRVMTARTNLRMQLYANNRLLEETGVSPEAEILNQKALAEYQNELIQTLGSDGFKRFSEWKQQAETDLMANNPGREREFEYL